MVAVVDDVYSDHSHIAGKFTLLSSSRVYVGGAVNPRALSGARVHTNFVGCLRKVCVYVRVCTGFDVFFFGCYRSDTVCIVDTEICADMTSNRIYGIQICASTLIVQIE